MKIQPRLFLTSFCTLLASTAMLPAQQPPPRFGYGSVPRTSSVISPPKTVKTSNTSKAKSPIIAAAKPKAKVKPAKLEEKPRPKIVASKKSASKSDITKNSVQSSSVKSAIVKIKTKEIASSKRSVSVVKPATTSLDKVSSLPLPNRNKALLNTTKATPIPLSDNIVLASNRPSSPLADSRVSKFHFFGSPIFLPQIAASPATQLPADRKTFVDLMAARHSLGRSVSPASVPTIASKSKQAEAVLAPKLSSTNTNVELPHILPQPLVARDFPDEAPTPTNGPSSTDLLDGPTLAHTVLASLSLASSANPLESVPESTLLDEPPLPSPVVSTVKTARISNSKSELKSKSEPSLPLAAPESPTIPAEVEAGDAEPSEHDLSDRERAFVRSLAEAAGSITTASGQLNRDLPASIPTAASTLMNQIPAETISTFRTLAKSTRTSAHEMVPDLPLEISNDLIPISPEKMPDQLPSFNAAPSGKIDVQSDRQADYDQVNSKVIFTGKVELNSAAIRLKAERVEVFMKKGGGGMERVEASGNVLMRTQDTANGPGQMASAGRVSYNLKTGEITLADWPKIQEATKSHISTDPSTKMVLSTDGRLRTVGPNRTLIGGG